LTHPNIAALVHPLFCKQKKRVKKALEKYFFPNLIALVISGAGFYLNRPTNPAAALGANSLPGGSHSKILMTHKLIFNQLL
jgi:hypothetical protein